MKPYRRFLLASGAAAAAVGGAALLQRAVPLAQMLFYASRRAVLPFDGKRGGDRIHFLNTQGADAILLESGGLFALIDAAEDSDNPRGFPELAHSGYERRVLAYLKKAAGDARGNVMLDCIVGTHAHSDHLGGFDTILDDPAVSVKRAYVKAYHPQWIRRYEREKWDNQEVYDQMLRACRAHGVELVQEIPKQRFAWGNFQLTFFNTEAYSGPRLRGENENSLALLVERGKTRVFLAGDLNNLDGAEDAIGPLVGHVNVLKVGHHGYAGSTSEAFVRALSPDIAILTNTIHGVDAQVRRRLNRTGTAVYATKEHDGIVLSFVEDGLKLYDGIHAAAFEKGAD